MTDRHYPQRCVDTPREVAGDAAARWWWDAHRLLFRSSLPLLLIALTISVADVLISTLIRAIPLLEIPLVLASAATAPVWVAATVVAMRWSDLGRAALRVTVPRLRLMAKCLAYLLIPLLAAIGVLMRATPDGGPVRDYAPITWSLLIMIGFMAWPNLVGSSVLVAYHDKDPGAARRRMKQGWSLNGWTTALSSAAVGLLAMCGAASAIPTPMAIFSSAILAQILIGVLYAGYVDIFEKRLPAPGFGSTFK